MGGQGWTYVPVGDTEVRYRVDPGQHANPSSAFTVEYFRRGEWGPVRNWSSRDWFAIGYHAGLQERNPQTTLDLGATTDVTPEARARGFREVARHVGGTF